MYGEGWAILMWNYEECVLRRDVIYALFMNDYDLTCPLPVNWVQLNVGCLVSRQRLHQ